MTSPDTPAGQTVRTAHLTIDGSGDLQASGGAEIFLNFHGIGSPPQSVDDAERPYWWDEGSFLTALDAIADQSAASSAKVFITFDDGNTSDVAIAMPALLKRRMTAAFFVCAGRVGSRGYLNRSDIQQLLNAGMRIGSHGMHHVDWRKLDDTGLHAEISDSKRLLEDICGSEVDEASIPFGRYDRRVLNKLKSEGYGRAYTSDGGTVFPTSWLKARNTLDRSWQGKHPLDGLAARDTRFRRLRRFLAGKRKALW